MRGSRQIRNLAIWRSLCEKARALPWCLAVRCDRLVMHRLLNFLCLSAILCGIAAVTGCAKPERPLPSGPGVTPDKADVQVQNVPRVSDGARASSLTAEQRAIVVARIGERTITLGDLEARLDMEPVVVKSQFASIQKRKDYLAKLVQFEVLVLEAQRLGLDKDPEVLEAMRQAMVRRFLQDAAADDDAGKTVTDADLKAYYDANLQVFHKPEQVELSHILLGDQTKAEQIKTELERGAEGNSAKLVALWNDYVVRLSEDKATAPYLGALGMVSKIAPPGADAAEMERLSRIPSALIAAAVAAEPMVVGPVVHSDLGWHVWMITSKSPAVDKSFDDAKESIRARIVKRERDLKRQRLLDELRAKAKVTIDDDAVRLIAAPVVDRKGTDVKAGGGMVAPGQSTATGAP